MCYLNGYCLKMHITRPTGECFVVCLFFLVLEFYFCLIRNTVLKTFLKHICFLFCCIKKMMTCVVHD